MPLIETKGALSAQGFGEFAKTTAPVYIEDVMSVWLYTGNGSTQTITNGIDLAGKGGLVWVKSRSNAQYHALNDTARGAGKVLQSQSTDASINQGSDGLSAFTSSGFSVGMDGAYNNGTWTYASWTFREQPKFFDVVTWTGDGVTNRAVTHSLGSTPGCIIVKRTDTVTDWYVYHRSSNSAWTGGTTAGVTTGGNATGQLKLNQTGAFNAFGGVFTYINSTAFGVNFDDNSLNVNGGTYVAYLFAHDAGGFGLTGTDNVISCGSFTTDGSGNATVNLGYEPQWIVVKATNQAYGWEIYDTMRGIGASGTNHKFLYANTSAAEGSSTGMYINSTGFLVGNNYWGPNVDMIYIAIRRGPMKTPTSGTSVFSPIASSAATGTALTTNFPIDLQMINLRTGNGTNTSFIPRLTGMNSSANNNSFNYLVSSSTAAEAAAAFSRLWDNTGFQMPSYFGGSSNVFYSFQRAPGFFDVVCYTGNGTAGTAISHNLGVVPELVITKKRSGAASWYSLYQPAMRVILLNNSNGYLDASLTKFYFGNNSADVSPTASTFTVASDADINQSGATYVAYLFASVAGVSKVGSYTGTGALQTINCGFTGGARFVLIKRTDSAGSWYVYDSARGISSGNDPYLLLNSTAAEVTGTNYVDTTSVGFQVTAAAPADLNANGGTYIFLAIA